MARSKRKLEPGQYSIPPFIRVTDNGWCLAERATVAVWREAQQVGTTDNDKHTLLQFRAATQMLELAQEQGLADDACPMDWLVGLSAPKREAGIIQFHRSDH
jgi:hypothetical protein